MLVRSLVCLIVSSSLLTLAACSGSPSNGNLGSGLEDGDAGVKKKATKKAEAEEDDDGKDKDTVTDPDKDPDPKPATCALENMQLQGTCGSCLSKSCCTQFKACDKSPDCLSLAKCASACEDDACIEICVNEFPNGVDTLVATGECRKAKCSAQCK